jgi:hypothetical protein
VEPSLQTHHEGESYQGILQMLQLIGLVPGVRPCWRDLKITCCEVFIQPGR